VCHSALSLWLASGAPPAEIAARAGHSVHVLLAVYAHCVPGHDQIANHKIESGLGSAAGPRIHYGPRLAHIIGGPHPPQPVRYMSEHSGTQRDPVRPSGTPPHPPAARVSLRPGETPAERERSENRKLMIAGVLTITAAGRSPARIWPTTGPQAP
jgi:hypothetical protein